MKPRYKIGSTRTSLRRFPILKCRLRARQVSLSAAYLQVESTHRNQYLCGRKPDISVYPSNVALSAASVCCLGEIKKPRQGRAATSFVAGSKGQAIHYATLALNSQHARQDVTVFLTDCRTVVFFSAQRGPDLTITYRESLQYDLCGDDSLGRCLLLAILTSIHPSIPFCSEFSGKEVIGATFISTIFTTSCPDDVLKLCSNTELLAIEAFVLENLEKSLGRDEMMRLGIIRLKSSSVDGLVLTPRAKGPSSRLISKLMLPLSCLAPIVSALQAVHLSGFFHRDVRAANMLLLEPKLPGGSYEPILADFGCSCTESIAEPLIRGGASKRYWARTTSDRKFRAQDDLHIFVRALYGIRNDLPNDDRCFPEFWDNVGTYTIL